MYLMGDELYASTESDVVRRVDPVTLETHEDFSHFSDFVAVNNATAHPHTDLDSGDTLNMGNSVEKGEIELSA